MGKRPKKRKIAAVRSWVDSTMKDLLENGSHLQSVHASATTDKNGHKKAKKNKRSRAKLKQLPDTLKVDNEGLEFVFCSSKLDGEWGELVERKQASRVMNTRHGGIVPISQLFKLVRALRISALVMDSFNYCKFLVDYLVEWLLFANRGSVPEGQVGCGSTREYIPLVSYMLQQLRPISVIFTDGISPVLSVRDRIRTIIACDQCYHQLFYFRVTISDIARAAVQEPEHYYTMMEALVYRHIDEYSDTNVRFIDTVRAYVHDVLGDRQRDELGSTYGLELKDGWLARGLTEDEKALPPWNNQQNITNPLLDVMRGRWTETILLFFHRENLMKSNKFFHSYSYTHASAQTTESDETTNHLSSMRNSAGLVTKLEVPPVCDVSLLQLWRDTARDWLTHRFAYACPSLRAISLLAKYAPILEAGCGTGYWAGILQRCQINTLAFDKDPSGDGASNEYHGNFPAFAVITPGTPETQINSNTTHRALFLCYPAPESKMALQCLHRYEGDVVIHVGELVYGDTGTKEFTTALQKNFALHRRLALPNFCNTAYEMTVWKRRIVGKKPKKDLPLYRCFRSACTSTPADEAKVWNRSTFDRSVYYCSKDCANADADNLSAQMAHRFVFFKTCPNTACEECVDGQNGCPLLSTSTQAFTELP